MSGKSRPQPTGTRGWPELIRHYGRVHRPRNEAERDWFRRQPSLAVAVKLAGLAENEKGRRYRHQYRISRSRLEEASDRLLSEMSLLRKARSFHDLHQMVNSFVGDIRGLGELYVYD